MLTTEEIRTLMELVADKAIQSFVTRTKLAGINIAPLPQDKEMFAHQLQWWNGPLLQEIRSRGYWDIHIRPATFEQERLPLTELEPVLKVAAVNYRGWEFPYINPQRPEYGDDWIGLEYQKESGLQAWRFFQSGHFAAQVGFLDDWEDRLTFPIHDQWQFGMRLSILDVVFLLTEVFGLAAHLATTDVYRDERSVAIDATMHGVKDRVLYSRGAWSLMLPFPAYRTSAVYIAHPMLLAKEDVIGRPQELAIEAAQYYFARFGGYNPSKQLLTTIQSEILVHP